MKKPGEKKLKKRAVLFCMLKISYENLNIKTKKLKKNLYDLKLCLLINEVKIKKNILKIDFFSNFETGYRL